VSGIWYFAYGSNMETATLGGRRRIRFARALPARAAGWRLVLDKPPLVPIGEAFANVVPDAAAHVLGVLYEPQRHDSTLMPSHRYMACLIAGAVEHGLPPEYVAWLRTVPRASTDGGGVAVPGAPGRGARRATRDLTDAARRGRGTPDRRL